MQYTFLLFKHFYKKLPPLVPKEIKNSMERILDSWKEHPHVGIEEIEGVMIKFGYEVWPYAQAFNDFYNINLQKQGEHFLLSFLNSSLQERFLDFKNYGGSLEELISGNPAEFFESEERAELCVALVEMEQKLREFTRQEVLTLRKKEYLKKVKEYNKTLKNLQTEIKHLYKLAHDEEEHPILASEIKAKAKSLEYSLCILGPDTDHANVCELQDFYQERKIHLNNLKGIHLVKQIDFYS